MSSPVLRSTYPFSKHRAHANGLLTNELVSGFLRLVSTSPVLLSLSTYMLIFSLTALLLGVAAGFFFECFEETASTKDCRW